MYSPSFIFIFFIVYFYKAKGILREHRAILGNFPCNFVLQVICGWEGEKLNSHYFNAEVVASLMMSDNTCEKLKTKMFKRE